jgi:DNA polymerase III delta prime subunit
MRLETALACARLCVEHDTPFMLHGSPGTGKTDGIRALARDIGIPCHTETLSTMESVDLRGLPIHDGEGGVTWAKPDFLLKLEALCATSRDGRVLFFVDEINSNSQSVQIPLMQLMREREIGPHKLPAGVRLGAAGNLQSDRAAAQRMGTALANRMAHFDVDAPTDPDSVRSWAKWAAGAQVHPMMIAFIMLRGAENGAKGAPGYQPGCLFNFRPEEPNSRAFASPRSVAEAARYCDAPDSLRRYLVESLCGEAFAAEFEGFVQVYRSAPPVLSILSNPNGAPVPSEPGVQFAVSLALARAADHSNFDAVLTYVARIGREFEIVTATDAIRRNPDLTDTRAFIVWAARNADVTI